MRNYIHVMLCANMFVAQLLFVVGVERTENEVSVSAVLLSSSSSPSLPQYMCSVFAVVLHYMFIVVFMWMLMEGVVMYIVLVKVFVHKQGLYIATFTVISYGVCV